MTTKAVGAPRNITLLNIIGGMDSAASGTISYLDQDLTYHEMVVGKNYFEKEFGELTPNIVLCQTGDIPVEDIEAKLKGIDGFDSITDDAEYPIRQLRYILVGVFRGSFDLSGTGRANGGRGTLEPQLHVHRREETRADSSHAQRF